ncbi:MAG TPA: hypothetical protein VI358_14400 [Pseudolabrys sp.]
MAETIDKKLREAACHLEEMRKQERRAFGDKERFDFSLSAFLSATTSACDAAIKKWTAIWKAGLSPEEESLYDFMREDRRIEVHSSGSRRDVKQDAIKVGVGGSYSDESGTLTVMGSNIPGSGMGGAVINKPHYYFTIDRVERDVTDVCADYLALLERMAAQFKGDNP